MKLKARKGTEEAPVRLYHWWPGRKYEGACPIPPLLLWSAEKRGSKYLTLAVTDLGWISFHAIALCCPKDFPSRAIGRTIALGRLEKKLKSYDYELVEAGHEE